MTDATRTARPQAHPAPGAGDAETGATRPAPAQDPIPRAAAAEAAEAALAQAELAAEQRRAIINRLKRANGQLAGIIAMLEDDRDCRDVITQLAAVSKAIDRAGFKVISSAMRGCIDGSRDDITAEDIEKLFLQLS
ncbi:metal-sensitive transcriptional regulator [Corynebacterium sphenisci]|uniref:metal-sensitive transcriptional regulator n=1 Tax=Corynebacterium sphenisci TaxID=191493 RepID=UPI0034A0A9A9